MLSQWDDDGAIYRIAKDRVSEKKRRESITPYSVSLVRDIYSIEIQFEICSGHGSLAGRRRDIHRGIQINKAWTLSLSAAFKRQRRQSLARAFSSIRHGTLTASSCCAAAPPGANQETKRKKRGNGSFLSFSRADSLEWTALNADPAWTRGGQVNQPRIFFYQSSRPFKYLPPKNKTNRLVHLSWRRNSIWIRKMKSLFIFSFLTRLIITRIFSAPTRVTALNIQNDSTEIRAQSAVFVVVVVVVSLHKFPYTTSPFFLLLFGLGGLLCEKEDVKIGKHPLGWRWTIWRKIVRARWVISRRSQYEVTDVQRRCCATSSRCCFSHRWLLSGRDFFPFAFSKWLKWSDSNLHIIQTKNHFFLSIENNPPRSNDWSFLGNDSIWTVCCLGRIRNKFGGKTLENAFFVVALWPVLVPSSGQHHKSKLKHKHNQKKKKRNELA